ncbi:MAG: hypothetical protein ACFFDT_09235 [Candidatus Hodarchaeota archaeon]
MRTTTIMRAMMYEGCLFRAAFSHTRNTVVCGLDLYEDSTYATILGTDSGVAIHERMTNDEVKSCCLNM